MLFDVTVSWSVTNRFSTSFTQWFFLQSQGKPHGLKLQLGENPSFFSKSSAQKASDIHFILLKPTSPWTSKQTQPKNHFPSCFGISTTLRLRKVVDIRLTKSLYLEWKFYLYPKDSCRNKRYVISKTNILHTEHTFYPLVNLLAWPVYVER